MPESPFHPVPRPRPTLLQRMLGRQPVEHALAALIDRLRAAPSPRDVSPETVDAIGRDHRVDIRAVFRHDLEGLYREYLIYCLTDRRLSGDELADLDHLRALLGLETQAVQAIQRAVSRQIYLKSVEEVLADGTVDPTEREFLHRLQQDLSIPESIADNIMDVKRQQMQAREKRRRG